MDREQNEIVVSHKSVDTGGQYLMALMKCADWIPKEYKMLADKNRGKLEVIKELYLCACDGVPIEKAIIAQEKEPPEGALHFVRQKHIEKISAGDYKVELAAIRSTADALENEVKQMSKTLNYIVKNAGDSEGAFPEELFPEEEENHRFMQKNIHAGTSEKKRKQPDVKLEAQRSGKFVVMDADIELSEDVPKSSTQEKTKDVPKSGTQEKTKDVLKSGTQEEMKDVPKFGTQKIWDKLKILKPRKKNITDYVATLMEEGYSVNQVDYLLGCIEEGMELEEVKKIASPKLPVDVMQRLRSMEERKENSNGKR